MIRSAIIPAAGFGTRFLPATKATPKELLPVLDRPVIQHVVEEAVAAGLTDIVIVIGPGKEAIREHFGRNPRLEDALARRGQGHLLDGLRRLGATASIAFAWQEEARGLGHAVLCGREVIGDVPFAVLLGDTILASANEVPVTGQLIETFTTEDAPVVACEVVLQERLNRYGIIAGTDRGDGTWRVEDLVEKPEPDQAPSNLAIASRYVFTPDIFDLLAATGVGKGGEIQLTDAMRALVRQRPLFARTIAGTRYDIGNVTGLIHTNVALALRQPALAVELRGWLRDLLAAQVGDR